MVNFSTGKESRCAETAEARRSNGADGENLPSPGAGAGTTSQAIHFHPSNTFALRIRACPPAPTRAFSTNVLHLAGFSSSPATPSGRSSGRSSGRANERGENGAVLFSLRLNCYDRLRCTGYTGTSNVALRGLTDCVAGCSCTPRQG